MNPISDKDYIDAKLHAATIQMVGDIKAANAAMDGRLAVIETRIDGKIEAIGQQFGTQFAELKAQASARNSDTVKWMAATMITLAALSMAYMTFLFNNAAPKSAPAPIVIYSQPAPVATAAPNGVSPAQAAKK